MNERRSVEVYDVCENVVVGRRRNEKNVIMAMILLLTGAASDVFTKYQKEVGSCVSVCGGLLTSVSS